ncbi:TetR/AcrR family transcriptional regulator [Roseovarius sp. TE539]|uniref:TetR/AcrR family transcriptional regulator n=1 Tax=Roseovarius sp. TE539 TaxID=2249812 RepID=UPI0015EFBBB4|nr:TetR/AcrR family transcriptional regulator [Roseovarius sp. TE539]
MAGRGRLSRDCIVEAAMRLLDREGEKAFSMRKLAADLGVDPMALYHYHANRGALIKDVLQALMETYDVPAPGPDWREDLRKLCNGLRLLARRHPGAFRVYELYEDWIPAEHRVQEAFHATLQRAGFPPQKTVRAVRLLLTYTEAFAVDEITGWLEPFDPTDREAFARSLSDGDFPVMKSLIDEIGRSDTDADFDFGLDVILRGLEAEIS